MQVQIEYESQDIRTACVMIKNGFIKNAEYNLKDIIDFAKKYHHMRLMGWEGCPCCLWEGWTSTGNELSIKGK